MNSQTERIVDWLSQMVQIPSVNPVQQGPRADVPGEKAMAEFLAARFRELGGEVEVADVLPERPNVYGIWRGKTDRWVALDVHTDTVSVEQMTDDPFDGRVENGRVWGRGAVDTKASLALILTLLEDLKMAGEKPEPNLIVVATMSEESGGEGAKAFAEWIGRNGIPLDQLMVAEPTDCTPVHGHKGILAMEFEVKGKTAHSAKPHLGQNAITAAAHLVVALEQEHERLQTVPPTSELGPSTLTVSIIEGGKGQNVVPDSCRIWAGKRLVPGEDPEEDLAYFEALATKSCPLPVEMKTRIGVPAFYQTADSSWIQQLAEWSGMAPSVVPYGTNALAYGGNLAKEMVIFGPGSIDQAHGEVEWVEIAELEKAMAIYEKWLGAGR
jgi:acetylornithine deacetylase/succinyl-diaminopimelate desuccinylase-like protein